MDLIHCDNLYVLDEQGRPVKEPNILSWVRWFEGANDLRVVARTQIGGSAVSTVFLAVDHRFRSEGPPILWETMVFGGKLDQEQNRCAGLREQAEKMHADMVQKVRATVPVWVRCWAWLRMVPIRLRAAATVRRRI